MLAFFKNGVIVGLAIVAINAIVKKILGKNFL